MTGEIEAELELSFQMSYKFYQPRLKVFGFRDRELPYPSGTTMIDIDLKRLCKVVVGDDEDLIAAYYYPEFSDDFRRYWDAPRAWAQLVPEDTF